MCPHGIEDGLGDFLNWNVKTSREVAASKSFASLFPQAKPYVDLTALAAPHALSFYDDIMGKPGDRPIGTTSDPAGSVPFVFDPKILALSYELAEDIVTGRSVVGGAGPGILSISFVDAVKLAGDYTMTLRVDRCPGQSAC